jgi:hypothetical protein
MDVNISNWYTEMPKRNYSLDFLHTQKNYKTIDQYYAPKNCICCKRSSDSDLCHKCSNNMQNTIAVLMNRIRDSEQKLKTLYEICRSCSSYHNINLPESHIPCISHDCPAFYAIRKNSIQITRNQNYTKITSIDW